VLTVKNLSLHQRLQRLDHLCIGIAEQRAKEVRAERAPDAGGHLDDSPAALEAIESWRVAH
jgi:hypothetical protein